MSEEKNVNNADSSAQVPPAVPAAAPVSAALSKAELKAAKAKAKVDAKLEKARLKDAKAQQKAEAKSKAASPEPRQKPEAQEKPEVQEKPEAQDKQGEQKPAAATPKPDAPAAPKAEAAPESADAAADKTQAAEPAPSAVNAAEPEKNEPAEAKAEQVKAEKKQEPVAGEVQAPSKSEKSSAEPEPRDTAAALAAGASSQSKSEASTQDDKKPQDEADDDPVASRRRKKLDKARAAAQRDAEHSSGRKKVGAVFLSLSAVVASAGVVAAGSLFAPTPKDLALPAAVTSLPAGDAVSVCAATPQLLKGVEGTDPQFAPGAKEVSSNLRSAAVSDLAKRIPGSNITQLGGSSQKQLTEAVPEKEAAESRSADDEGLTGRTAKVNTVNNADGQQVFSLQPLGQLPSIGSGLRSYQAKDGDLAGLAASSCLAPASNWRFTGLDTTTGSTSVLHISNPTSTTAQVSVDLRGPKGLIDTGTLQNVVVAPGEERAIVMGGYAQDMSSVAATVTSTGGKISAYVQQASLRGLTPSGVDLVAPNAAAGNTQVIPGVWIDSKENSQKLSKDQKNLIPQLHVAATGSQGAGYKVKLLGADGEVAASFDENLAAASNATSVVNLNQLAAGYYTVVVEADAPVTAAVRMVRGSDPKDPSDTAWAVASNPLAGNQVMPLSANGTGKFVLAAKDVDSTVDAVVVDKDGKLAKPQKLSIKAGQSIVFDPRDTNESAQAVIFSSDANAYVAQVILGSEQSIAWAAMPQANAGRDGIVVNVGG